MQSILDCYKDILTALRYTFDDDGLISTTTPTGTKSPATISGQRLVLPTTKRLRQGADEDHLFFHPLSENLARRGTSPVMQHMQNTAKFNIAYTVMFMAQQLLAVAIDQSTHKDLPPECSDFLKKLSNADKKTGQVFDKLMAAATKKNRLLTVYLKNGGMYDGKKVSRMAVIRFPLLEDLQSEEKDVLGVDIPAKHRKVITALLKLIVPFGDDPEEYSAGTNTRVAPYLTAFLKAYLKIATRLNQVIHTYAKPLGWPIKPFKLYDEKLIEHFPNIYDEIPAQRGNDGGVDETPDEAVVAPEKQKVAGQAQLTEKAQQPSRAQPAPAAKLETPRSTVSMAEFMAAQQPMQTQLAPMLNPNMQLQNNLNLMGMQGLNMSNMGGMSGNSQYAPAAPQLPWVAQQQHVSAMQQQLQNNPYMSIVGTAQPMQGGNTGMNFGLV